MASFWPDIPGRVWARTAVIVVISATSTLRFFMFESFVGGRRRKQLPPQQVGDEQTPQ
jgi:hypothetical protein